MTRFNLRGLLVALFLAGTIAGPAALTGCALLGVQTPENFNERVVAGYKTVTVVADLVGTLSAAGKINVADANQALDGAQTAKDGIDAAVALRNAGDFSNAETRLSAVIAALELLQAQLEARQ
jgi:hypothetical protein